MKDRDSMLNNHHLYDLHHQMLLQSPNSDLGASQDDFLDQFLSFVPPSSTAAGASFPWAADDQIAGMVEDQPTAALASKMRQQQISSGAARVLMLQQQLLLSRGNGPMLNGDQNGVVDAQSFDSVNLTNDASVKAAFNGFNGQIPNQPPQFFHNQAGALQQSPNFSSPAAPAMSQPAASGSTGGGSALGQPKPRVRARRGQATDPHSIAERLRRERIAERMKALQELVPNANKTDKASMLDEIIDYVKFLQLQVKVLSMSRLGGAAAVAPLVADESPEGRNGNGMHMASASNSKEGMTPAAEQQVAKLMEEDMGSAMQYLQGKGLCLMPISLATAISTTTSSSQCQNHRSLLPLLSSSINPLLCSDGVGAGVGPSSPSMSVLTAQSVTINGGGEASVKDIMAASKQE